MSDQILLNIVGLDNGQLRQVAETLLEIADDYQTRHHDYRTINIRREGNDVVYEVDAKTGNVGTGYIRRIPLRTPQAQWPRPANIQTTQFIRNLQNNEPQGNEEPRYHG